LIDNKITKKLNETTQISNIVNKYAKHSMQNEMDVFTKIFKNYTNTNMNSVDMNAVNNKIRNFVNPVGIKNDDNSNQNNLRMNKIK
jgi:hypothetical protein